jgi:cytochrome b involved in lipid metabolism
VEAATSGTTPWTATTTATAPTTEQVSTTTPPAAPAPTPTIASYTLAQVGEHGVEGNCWSAINGQVYDLGAWINKHPGGDRAILSICGKDGSAAFNGQHGGDKKPERVLAGFEIGVLAQ